MTTNTRKMTLPDLTESELETMHKVVAASMGKKSWASRNKDGKGNERMRKMAKDRWKKAKKGGVDKSLANS